MIDDRVISKPLRITKKINRGYGLADFEDKKVFIQTAVPEDLVRVRRLHTKQNVIFGEIEELLEASPCRQEPGCEVFGKCGGCDWLNIKRDKQLEYKEQIIREIFHDQIIDKRLPIVSAGADHHYRNKCYYPLRISKGKPVFGMFARLSHQLVPHRRCLIQPEIFDEVAATVCRQFEKCGEEIYNEIDNSGNVRYLGFRINEAQDKLQVVIVTRKRRLAFTNQLVRVLRERYPEVCAVIQNINPTIGNSILGKTEKILWGEKHMNIKLAGKIFRVAYNSFFQVNVPVMEKMTAFCLGALKASNCLLDAYCGAGVLGISLAETTGKLIGIDNSHEAIEDARQNAEANKLKNYSFICGDAEECLADILRDERVDSIIFDPPRKGLTRKIINHVNQEKVPQIIYISCNPITQVRDVRLFVSEGYIIDRMQSFDMFPQTWHIENIVVLRLK
jgi:23S rRNA (uracil1939-C5)-methyltransferase